MIYETPLGSLTLADLENIQRRRMDPYVSDFEWKAEYLPVIIGFAGIMAIGIIYNYRKRKRKK